MTEDQAKSENDTNSYFFFTRSENLGWECPRCGVVYAPHIHRCDCGRRSMPTYPPPMDWTYYQGPYPIYTDNNAGERENNG